MNKAKILIVDDRQENLLVLESLIDEPNVELIKATSGQDALAATLDHNFALVLLDVNMPGMSGHEVAELMRSNKSTKHIPIIFVTAERKEQSQIFKGYDAGAVDYLLKPLEPPILHGKIAIFLEVYFQRTELEIKTKELDAKLIELEILQKELEEKNKQLTHLSITDGLTSLYNRRKFDEILDEEWSRAMRSRQPMSVLLLDIDNFKSYNDNFGHPQGDEVLKIVARNITAVARRNLDKTARYGGEEFVALLPDTDLNGAEVIAERMRLSIYEQNIPHLPEHIDARVTVSIGIASIIPQPQMRPMDFVNTADIKLYEAKDTGKNCWCS